MVFVGILLIMIIITAYSYNRKLQKLQAQFDESVKHGKKIQLDTNVYKGEINEILGSFILLDDYDHLSIIGSVSKAASFDLIGLKDDRLDFIEIKSPRTRLSTTENKIQKIIEAGNVFYRIIESGIPSQFVTKERSISGKKNAS